MDLRNAFYFQHLLDVMSDGGPVMPEAVIIEGLRQLESIAESAMDSVIQTLQKLGGAQLQCGSVHTSILITPLQPQLILIKEVCVERLQ
jgi:hypothetical protein